MVKRVKHQKQNILVVMADQPSALALGGYSNPSVKSAVLCRPHCASVAIRVGITIHREMPRRNISAAIWI